MLGLTCKMMDAATNKIRYPTINATQKLVDNETRRSYNYNAKHLSKVLDYYFVILVLVLISLHTEAILPKFLHIFLYLY